jgi:hypothetical protein
VKVADLRPCDCCGEDLGQGFQLVRTCAVLRSSRSASRLAVRLGESVLDSDPELMVTGELMPDMMTELQICLGCFAKMDLPILAARRWEEIMRARGGVIA